MSINDVKNTAPNEKNNKNLCMNGLYILKFEFGVLVMLFLCFEDTTEISG